MPTLVVSVIIGDGDPSISRSLALADFDTISMFGLKMLIVYEWSLSCRADQLHLFFSANNQPIDDTETVSDAGLADRARIIVRCPPRDEQELKRSASVTAPTRRLSLSITERRAALAGSSSDSASSTDDDDEDGDDGRFSWERGNSQVSHRVGLCISRNHIDIQIACQRRSKSRKPSKLKADASSKGMLIDRARRKSQILADDSLQVVVGFWSGVRSMPP